MREALRGATVVFHCAAKVGDWGPVEDYRAVNVEALRGLLDACRNQPLQRFVHFSSLGVYAARHHYGADETEPPPARHMDGYTQTKVEAEQLALRYQREYGVPVVVLRPGFIYGPRDRTVLPSLIEKLRRWEVAYIGDNRRAMNCIYVGNLVDAALLAVEKPEAVGQIYNLTDGEPVSKRRFIETVAAGAGVPKPFSLGVPLWTSRFTAWWMERLMALLDRPSRSAAGHAGQGQVSRPEPRFQHRKGQTRVGIQAARELRRRDARGDGMV